MGKFTKTFPFEPCKACIYTYGKSEACKTCDGDTNFNELYDADPNCIHVVRGGWGGGLHCEKCKGWFCF